MTVTLNTISRELDSVENENLQSADKEHDGHTDLLAPRKLQLENLIEREDQHPDIKHDTDDRVTPGQRIHVDTVAIVLLIPVVPVVADWPTLKYSNDDECDTV